MSPRSPEPARTELGPLIAIFVIGGQGRRFSLAAPRPFARSARPPLFFVAALSPRKSAPATPAQPDRATTSLLAALSPRSQHPSHRPRQIAPPPHPRLRQPDRHLPRQCSRGVRGAARLVRQPPAGCRGPRAPRRARDARLQGHSWPLSWRSASSSRATHCGAGTTKPPRHHESLRAPSPPKCLAGCRVRPALGNGSARSPQMERHRYPRPAFSTEA
jgi:hypothetical protein